MTYPRIAVWSTSSLLLLISCSRPALQPVATTPDRPPPVVAAVAADAPISVALDSVPVRYQIESRSAISLQTDTLTAIDSISISAVVWLQARSQSNGVAVVGRVERLSITTGLGSSRETESHQSPSSVEWMVFPDSISVRSGSAPNTCDQVFEAARDVLLAVFPPLLAAIKRDQVWNSSHSQASCRSGVTFTVTTRSTTNASNFDDAAAARKLVLSSDGRISVRGTGKQGATDIVLSGSGTTATLYELSLVPGVVQSVNARSRIELEFDLGYRTDRVLQKTVRTMVLIR